MNWQRETEYQKLVEEIEDELTDYHIRMENFLSKQEATKAKEWKDRFNNLNR